MVADARPDRKRLRVLVVDDNQDAAKSLCVLIGLWGHEARAVHDGLGALDEARSYRPDCLFLDINLPGLDGYGLARRLREDPELDRAKLVALSAYSSGEHARRVQKAGFDHQLVKPADPAEIEGLLTMLSEVRALAQETRELVGETRDELREVRQEIRAVEQELREVKDELRDVKNVLGEGGPG
jgi:two-component system OmpR family response regulator